MAKMYDPVELKAFAETFLADPILKMAVNAVLRNAPAVEAEPVVHGRWIWKTHHGAFGEFHLWHCSICDTMRARQDPYCGECGAKMEVSKNGKN